MTFRNPGGAGGGGDGISEGNSAGSLGEQGIYPPSAVAARHIIADIGAFQAPLPVFAKLAANQPW